MLLARIPKLILLTSALAVGIARLWRFPTLPTRFRIPTPATLTISPRIRVKS